MSNRYANYKTHYFTVEDRYGDVREFKCSAESKQLAVAKMKNELENLKVLLSLELSTLKYLGIRSWK